MSEVEEAQLIIPAGSLLSLAKNTTVGLLGSADHDPYGSHAVIWIATIEAFEPTGR